MKITLISTWNTRCGIADYTRRLAGGLKMLGVDVSIAPIEKPESLSPLQFLRLGAQAKGDVVHIQYQPGIYGKTYLSNLNYYPLLALMLRLRGQKTIVTVHELMGGVFDKLFMRALRLADQVIVHTKTLEEQLRAGGVERITIMPHATLDALKLDRQMCKAKLGLAGRTVLTVLGFISPAKGHDISIEAMNGLSDDCVLLVAGGVRHSYYQPYYDGLKRYESDRIRFLGYIPEEDVPVVLGATDIAILPYRETQTSGALHLILDYGLPIVASDQPYFTEIRDAVGCVELFKTGSPSDLADKIIRLLNDPAARERLSGVAMRFADESSWPNIAHKTWMLYLELLAAHPDSIYTNSPAQINRLNWLKNLSIGTTLEVGCATGYISYYVGAKAGLDLDENRIQLAWEKYPCIDFAVGDATHLPYRDDSFDTVLLPEILEHVPFTTAKQVLREAQRVARGHVAITMPNANRLGYDKDVETGGKNPEHLWHPTSYMVTALLLGTSFYKMASKDGLFWLVEVWPK